jgi:hypothetical protein
MFVTFFFSSDKKAAGKKRCSIGSKNKVATVPAARICTSFLLDNYWFVTCPLLNNEENA